MRICMMHACMFMYIHTYLPRHPYMRYNHSTGGGGGGGPLGVEDKKQPGAS